MKTKTVDRILFFAVLVVAGLLILVPMAHATGTPATTAPSAASQASASAKAGASASSALDLSLATNPVQSYRGGETYALAAPASAAPLPSGLCPKGDSESFSIVWGLVSWAKSSTRTEMECLDKVLTMLRDTAPKSVVVVNYIQPEPQKPARAETARLADPAPIATSCNKQPVKPAPKKHVKKPKACVK